MLQNGLRYLLVGLCLLSCAKSGLEASGAGTNANQSSSSTTATAVDNANQNSSSTTATVVDNANQSSSSATATANAQLYWSKTYQSIDGFGASSAWMSGSVDQKELLYLYSDPAVHPESLGLSWLRVRIAPNGTTSATELKFAQEVIQLGGKVWATPWSPPASWKSSNSPNGGSLLPRYYNDYAAQQIKYLQSMNAQGIWVRYLSVQNEPDQNTTYESCEFSPTALASFIGNSLGPALVQYNQNVPNGQVTHLLAPETSNLAMLSQYTQQLAQPNSDAAKYLDLLASHEYGANPQTVLTLSTSSQQLLRNRDLIDKSTRSLWNTEYYIDAFGGLPSGSHGVTWTVNLAELIHHSLVDLNMSAWHYWWISTTSGQAAAGGLWLTDTQAFSADAGGLGHFSKFVRPGYVRFDISNTGKTLVSAYHDSTHGNFAIVVINPTNTAITQNLTLNWAASELTPYVSDSNGQLKQKAVVMPNNSQHRFSYTLPANAVVTLVGSKNQ